MAEPRKIPGSWMTCVQWVFKSRECVLLRWIRCGRTFMGDPKLSCLKELADLGLNSCQVHKMPWRRKPQPTSVCFSGKSHERRSWSGIHGITKKSDTTEWLSNKQVWKCRCQVMEEPSDKDFLDLLSLTFSLHATLCNRNRSGERDKEGNQVPLPNPNHCREIGPGSVGEREDPPLDGGHSCEYHGGLDVLVPGMKPLTFAGRDQKTQKTWLTFNPGQERNEGQ